MTRNTKPRTSQDAKRERKNGAITKTSLKNGGQKNLETSAKSRMTKRRNRRQ